MGVCCNVAHLDLLLLCLVFLRDLLVIDPSLSFPRLLTITTSLSHALSSYFILMMFSLSLNQSNSNPSLGDGVASINVRHCVF